MSSSLPKEIRNSIGDLEGALIDYIDEVEKNHEEEVTRLEKKIEKLEEEIDSKGDRIGGLEEEVKELQQKLELKREELKGEV